MLIDRLINRKKAKPGGIDPVEKVIVQPEAAKPEHEALESLFTKMDTADQVPAAEEVADIAKIVLPSITTPDSAPTLPGKDAPASSVAPQASPDSGPKPEAKPAPNEKDDLISTIFQEQEKEENAALLALIASLPMITIDDLLSDINQIKGLIRDSLGQQTGEQSGD